MLPKEIVTKNRKALTFCTNAKGLPFGLFAAAQAARLAPDRDFDILICSLEPLDIPQYFLDLGIRSVVLDLGDTLEQQNFTTWRLPQEAYLWMWFPHCLGHLYERILFLDLDTYVMSDELSDLMAVDLGGHAIGAVREIAQWDNLNAPVKEFKARGLRGMKFLNSGMVLMDTQAYIAQGILDEVLKVNAEGGKMKQHDQSLINLALMGEWAELNPVWNWQWTRAYPFYHDYVGAQILHFQGHQKPWDEGEKQTRFSRVIVAEYYVFLNNYFPEQAFTMLPAAAFARPLRAIVVDLLDHLRKLPRLYRLMRRFKSDRDVL